MTSLSDKERLPREIVAMRVAKELPDGAYVNLGIGIPTLVSSFVPEGRTVYYHSESGILNCGPIAAAEEEDIDLINAGGQYLQSVEGMSFFDSAEAFAMIRGGHVDVTVLGSHQVSATGDLANWMIPGSMVKGPGGAMDLVSGAKRVLIVMDHLSKGGDKKVLKECTLPLTGKTVVHRIITSLAVLDVTPDGLQLIERAPGTSIDEIQDGTDSKLVIKGTVPEIVI